MANTTKIKTTIAKHTFTSCQGGKGPVQHQRAREGLCQSRGEKKCLENGQNRAKDSSNKEVSKIITKNNTCTQNGVTEKRKNHCTGR